MGVFCENRHGKLQQAQIECDMKKHMTCLHGHIDCPLGMADSRVHTSKEGEGVGFEAVRTRSRWLEAFAELKSLSRVLMA